MLAICVHINPDVMVVRCYRSPDLVTSAGIVKISTTVKTASEPRKTIDIHSIELLSQVSIHYYTKYNEEGAHEQNSLACFNKFPFFEWRGV